MPDKEQIFEQYEFEPESRELFMMNFTIKYLHGLPRPGLTENKDVAHEAALIEDPYMTQAIGYLALSAEHYGKTFTKSDHSVKESFKAFLEIARASRAFKRTQQNIYNAYRASSHIS